MGDHMILPGHVSDEYETGANAAAAGPDISQAMAFRDVLKALDPYLDLIWVREGAVNFPVAARWYMVRWHPGGNDELNAYWVVQNPDGSYCPPDDRHIEALRRIDSHSRNAYEELRQRRTDRQAARRKEFDARREAFKELLLERISHLHDARISVPKLPAAMVVERDKTIVAPDGKILSDGKPKAKVTV